MYVRWVQFGAFQPILRLHSDHGDRLPWEYGDRAERIASGFLRLRESLVPYIYTTARQAYDSGLPIARPMYLDWPRAARAYRYDGQYMLGDELLVAPVAEPGPRRDQAGLVSAREWVDVFTGEVTRRRPQRAPPVPLERMPVFARAGAIVPRQPDPKVRGGQPIRWRSTSTPAPTVLLPLRGRRATASTTSAASSRARPCAGTRTPRRYNDRPRPRPLPGHRARRRYQLRFIGVDRPASHPQRRAAGRASCAAGATTPATGRLETSVAGRAAAPSGSSSGPPPAPQPD